MWESAEMIGRSVSVVIVLLSGRRRLGAANEPTRQRTRGLAVAVDLFAGHERVPVAVDVLQEPLAAGREGELEPGRMEAQGLEVDHVHVGPVPGGEHAPVEEPDGAGRLPALLLHDEGQIETLAPRPVAAPVDEERGGEAAVADRAHVGATITEPGD